MVAHFAALAFTGCIIYVAWPGSSKLYMMAFSIEIFQNYFFSVTSRSNVYVRVTQLTVKFRQLLIITSKWSLILSVYMILLPITKQGKT